MTNSSRENFSVTLDDKVVGFVSVYFLNNRRSCLKFAFRVSKDIRGKGYGRQITKLLDQTLREKNPELRCVVSAIPDLDMKDEEILAAKLGTLLTVKVVHEFKLLCCQVPWMASHVSVLREVSKEEFHQMLREGPLSTMFENNVIHLNWVPVIMQTEDDVRFVTRKKQRVLIDQDSQSLSVLTLPYPVPGGLRASIDYFSIQDCGHHLEDHIVSQLNKLRHQLDDKDKDLFISIVLPETLNEEFWKITNKVGLEQFKLTRGTIGRPYGKMYIYQKSLA